MSAPANAADERKSVRVTIYNQPYSLVATEEPGQVEALAQSVDELMTEIAPRAGNVDSNRVAVLACLHLADRVQSLERELAGLRARVDGKAREFSLLLDAALK
jgi:cell division protein ZapA